MSTYCYLYDQFLSGQQYFRTLSAIETILTDLGINGKVFRLSPLNSTQEIIRDQVRKGTKNLVVVGNDHLVGQVIDTLAQYTDVALGIIPMGKPQEIAKTFGIPEEEAACQVLSTRLIRQIRLARVNDRYFLYQAEVKNPFVQILCQGKYQVTPVTAADVKIYNVPTARAGRLRTVVQPRPIGLMRKKVSQSVFTSRQFRIEGQNNKPVKIIADHLKEVVCPALIETTDLKLKVIVGKGLS